MVDINFFSVVYILLALHAMVPALQEQMVMSSSSFIGVLSPWG